MIVAGDSATEAEVLAGEVVRHRPEKSNDGGSSQTLDMPSDHADLVSSLRTVRPAVAWHRSCRILACTDWHHDNGLDSDTLSTAARVRGTCSYLDWYQAAAGGRGIGSLSYLS